MYVGAFLVVFISFLSYSILLRTLSNSGGNVSPPLGLSFLDVLRSPTILPPPLQGTPLNEGGFYWNCRHIYHFSLAPLNEVDFIGAAVMLIILP
jgi:hypothetical protein